MQEIENLHECGAAFGETVTNQFLSLRLNMDSADDSKTHPHIINAATIISQYSQTPAPQRKEDFTLIYHWQKTKTFLSVTADPLADMERRGWSTNATK